MLVDFVAMGAAAGEVSTYFAYGSNMLFKRLQARSPAARLVSVARLRAYRLAFDKQGAKDGSGKCRVVATGNEEDVVWGVLYRLEAGDRRRLDRAEGVGRGYSVGDCRVELLSGEVCRAFTYLAEPTHVKASVRPFAWYRELVVAGAVEHRLPEDYLAMIRAVPAIADPDCERSAQARRILRCPGVLP